jgi:hypothetical protein
MASVAQVVQSAVAAARSEAEDRKKRSEDILKKHNIAVPSLPRLVSTKEVKLRELEEVARRTMALCIVAARAEGNPKLPVGEVLKLIAMRGLAKDLTSAEKVFLGAPSPDKKTMQQYLWRYEAAWMLMWALGYVKNPGEMGKPCNVANLVQSVVPKSLVQLMEGAKLRTAGEILDMMDYAYRLHAAARQTLEKTDKPIPGVMIRVVFERHYALNWLIRRAEWDGPIV